MKITRVLFLTLAAASIAACSNDKEEEITGQKKDLIIEFNLPETVNTRAVENPVADKTAPTLENVTLTFDGGTPSVSFDKAALTSGKVTVQVNEATQKVTSMTANMSAGIDNDDINTFQGKAITTAIPLYAGETTIGDDNTVTLTPTAYVARIEILGGNSITPASGKFSNIYVTGVYVNNFYKKYTLLASTGNTAQQTKEGDWKTFYSSSTPANKMYNEGITTGNWTNQCAAYQIFPANTAATLPEITLKLSYKLNNGPKEGFITIRKFKKNSADLTAMEAGKIYKLDVSSIGSLFKEESGTGEPVEPTDPTPGKPKTDLAITITVTAWAAENITPNI